MQNEIIRLEDLSIGYVVKKQIRSVCEHITATISGNELTCILGANGIGKSTLMRTLSAFQPKLSGKIYIKGKEISDYKERELSQLISVVSTEKLSIRNMTAYELIGLGRSPYTGFWGRLGKTDCLIIDRSIDLIGIRKLAHRSMDTLSDGERQKVMIAKALVQETPIILLDEPTAFLDFPSKVDIMQLLHRLSRETDRTIFLSTHDLELALQIADKIWLMDGSGQVNIGIPEDLTLSGHLSNFFERDGIIFDVDSGLFRIENKHRVEIGLKGEDHARTRMVCKALLRNGILAREGAVSDYCVVVANDEVQVWKGDVFSSSHISIEKLLIELKFFMKL